MANLVNTGAKLSLNTTILAATKADETKDRESCRVMEMRAADNP
jgi:hypothetical protein